MSEKLNMPRVRVAVLLGFFMIVAPCDVLCAQEFYIHGNITHLVLNKSTGTEELRNRYEFDIDYQEGRWQNRMRDLLVAEGKKKDAPEWYVTAFDGTDHYKLIQFRHNKSTTNEYAFVKTGELSTEQSLALNILWFAFESGNYFSNVKGDLVVSPFPHGVTNQLRFNCAWRLKGSGLPGRLEFHLPGWEVRHLKSKPAPSGKGVLDQPTLPVVHYPPPYTKGYVGGVLTVATTVFIGDVELPREFTFERYVLRTRGTNAPERVLFERTRFACSRVESSFAESKREVKPALSLGASVHDFRFTNIAAHVAYANEGEGWLSRTNRDINAQVKELLNRRKASKKPPFALALARIAIMILIVVPCLAYIYHRISTARQNHINH